MICLDAVGASDPLVRACVQGLGDHNALWYRTQPRAPSPLSAGLLYLPDVPGARITLLDASKLYAAGEGSCGSLSAALYGYLRSRGQAAILLTPRVSNCSWHVMVRLATGNIWDPRSLQGKADAA